MKSMMRWVLIAVLLNSDVVYAQTGTRDNAGLQGNEGAVSGFFETSEPVNYPAGASSWWHLLDVRHSYNGNNFAMQFAGSFFDQALYFRKINNVPDQIWSKVLLERQGKVGIGTNNPSAALDVWGGKINITGEGLDGTAVISSQNGVAYYGNNTMTNGIAINNAGKVGIGTPTPNYELDVARYLAVGAQGGEDIVLLGGGVGIGAVMKLYYANGHENTRLTGNNDSWLNLVAGNVGIGLTNPSEKLTVNGKIKAREIRIDVQNMPDYVFEPDYQKLSLSALEEYIQKHKHLPEIPSAADSEKNGIELGEMNKILLKKVEELTLHLIEKDKQLKVVKTNYLDMKSVLQKLSDKVDSLERKSLNGRN